MTEVTHVELHLSARPGDTHKLLHLSWPSHVEIAREEFAYHKPEQALRRLAQVMTDRELNEAVVHDHGHMVTFSNDRVVLDVEHIVRFADSNMFKERAKSMLLPSLPEASEEIAFVVIGKSGEVFSRHRSHADAEWNARILGYETRNVPRVAA